MKAMGRPCGRSRGFTRSYSTIWISIVSVRRCCVAARNKGEAICTNRATIEREVVEDRVLIGLRDNLLHPDLIATFVEE